jgi:hypothetical protein
MPKQSATEQDPFQETAVVAAEPVLSQIPDTPLSTSQLLQLLAHMGDKQATMIAEAIVLAQKPYVDPKKEQNDKMFQEQNRRQMEQDRQAKHANQKLCPHIAGCNSLSEFRDHMNRTSIVWHKSDSTETFGICTNCQRIFRDNDPDYQEWRQKPCFNKASASGVREYADPVAAKERGRS